MACIYTITRIQITLKDYPNSNKFSNCSQRNAVSRYISIGIYDTDTMEPGKILTKPLNSIPMKRVLHCKTY